MIRQRDEHIDPSSSRSLALFRRWVPMTDAYHGQHLLVRKNGVLLATPLLAVLVLIEVTDVIFAVDSIPGDLRGHRRAVPGVHRQRVRGLGLRAMYFLLAD
jgi:tellurite resistance protein TerC